MEFHPEIVQGVTCESLGVEFIQIIAHSSR